MCFGILKKKVKPQIEVEGFNLLPKEEVIEFHQWAADSHAYWADAQTEVNDAIPNVGDVEHHLYCIDGHLSGKWYLEQGD